jgi:hypothetical protein
VGCSVLETLRLSQAFKAEEELGVVCAANWKPGDETQLMQPTVEGKYEYLERHFGDPPVAPTNSNLSRTSNSSEEPASARVGSIEQGTLHSANTAGPAINKAAARCKQSTCANTAVFPNFVHCEPTSYLHRDTNSSPDRRRLAETLRKMFGTTPASSPLPSPLQLLSDLPAAQPESEEEKKRSSGLSVRSYFDYEPAHSIEGAGYTETTQKRVRGLAGSLTFFLNHW